MHPNSIPIRNDIQIIHFPNSADMFGRKNKFLCQLYTNPHDPSLKNIKNIIVLTK